MFRLSKGMFTLGWGLICLWIIFSSLIDPLIHILYFRLTPFSWANELMTRQGGVLEYSDSVQETLAGGLKSLVAIGVVLLFAGVLARLHGDRKAKTENISGINNFRRSALGATLGFLAILSIFTNSFAGPAIRDSLPDPRLLSYLASQSVTPGERIVSHTHSPLGWYTSEIVRLSAEDKVVSKSGSIQGLTQAKGGPLSYLNGAMWVADVSPQLLAPQEPGIYSHRVSDKSSSFDSVFCVRPGAGQTAEIALLLNTNTWAAYNDWGGANLYGYIDGPNIGSQPPPSVSFLRPNLKSQPNIDNHLVGGELHFSRWLEKSSVKFDCLTDLDLDRGPVDSGVKLLILSTHPEYWSTSMYDHLEAFLASGGSLLYLGGNGIYWKSDLSREGLIRVNKKDGELWRNLGRPESAILGVRYGSDDYGTYAPFVVEDASHFLFEGLRLSDGDTFGHRSLIGSGASGLETDKSDPNSPQNGSVLARGLNEPEGGHVFSYSHPGGGLVLSFGSITSAAAIPLDEVMQGIFWNYLKAIGLS